MFSTTVDNLYEQSSLELKQDINNVNFLEFLYHYLSSGNFYKTVDALEHKYQAEDFAVSLGFFTLFYIIQNKSDVKKILNANTTTGYQNHNFDLSHQHDLNINATQAFINEHSMDKNPIWKNLHSLLAKTAGDPALINQLISKHIKKLFAKPTFHLDVAFEDFMLNFWCDYLFGSKVSAEEFKQTREKLLNVLKFTFYDSRLRNVPYIGSQACKLYRYLKKAELETIDAELQTYINQADSGLMHRFKTKLLESDFPKDKINQAILDNTFDFVLVFDFIHNAMYETLASIAKAGIDDYEERKKVYSQGLKTAFLFPFRTRVPQQDIKLDSITLAKGKTVYINLLKSGLQHSFGPRACIGIGVTNWIKEAIWQHLKGIELRVINTSYPESRERLSHNPDVPVSKERYLVQWQYPREYLQKHLANYQFKGVDKFYDVLKIYENPVLTGYIVSAFTNEIEKLNVDKSKLVIATPEVRGIPAASMVAQSLGIPLVVIRKPGKIPGPIFSKSYATAYSQDSVEISTTSEVKNKDVILIDDGIATGGTTKACLDLIEQAGGKTQLVLAMIDHKYKEKSPELQQYNIKTIFDFKKEAPKNEIILDAKQTIDEKIINTKNSPTFNMAKSLTQHHAGFFKQHLMARSNPHREEKVNSLKM